jgi:farnesyl diphosphate synthase
MAFLAELQRVAQAVEGRLDRLLARNRGKAPAEAKLSEAMRYAALGGGKRLRPFLLIESARLFGVAEEEALPAACALECVHCYSLVHDDLPSMDDDAIRRGRPTLHIAFDEATAILAGDALLTLAFEILSDETTHPDPAIRAELVLLLAKAGGWQGMALGQALDLNPERQGFSPSDVADMQALKTGALFRFACEAGAVLGRAPAAARAALRDYASSFGQPSSSPTTCSMPKATRRRSARRWPRTRGGARPRSSPCSGSRPPKRGLTRLSPRRRTRSPPSATRPPNLPVPPVSSPNGALEARRESGSNKRHG